MAYKTPSTFIQWKGTNVCLDFYCDCGARGHYDGYFAYALRCGACNKVWEMAEMLPLREAPTDQASVQDVEMVD